jgi:small subunit ribosomal protein S4
MKLKKKFKICRRLGPGVFEKCQSPKFLASQTKKVRGDRKKALSDFGLGLVEKQKLRFSYGVSEKQLRNYVKLASTVKGMTIGEKLIEILESRADNIVYKAGFAKTRRHARQLVSHGHFTINGVKTTIPSQLLKTNDVLSVRDGSKSSPIFSLIQENKDTKGTPSWLFVDNTKLSATLKSNPKSDDNFVDVGVVLEFYSR